MLHRCCLDPSLQGLKYLLSISHRFKTEMDISVKNNSGNNGLMLACQNKEISIENAKYLIENVYSPSKKFNINETNNRKETALDVAIRLKNESMVQAIVDVYYNECDLGSALTQCAVWWNLDMIIKLTNHPNVKPKVVKDNLLFKTLETDGKNILDIFVDKDNRLSFCKFLLLVMKLCDVGNWEDLMAKITIVNEKSFVKWINMCQKSGKAIFLSFLMNLDKKACMENNFEIFETMVAGAANDDPANEEAARLSEQYNKDFKNASYLYENCNASTLKNLSDVINNGLLNHECGFNDSFLFLVKMIDNDTFVINLENITKDCLSDKTKNVRKYTFFKNNLLESNIWASTSSESGNSNDEKNDDSHNDNLRDSSKSLLFNKVKNNVIENELETQKMFIQNAIMSEEKTNEILWKELKSQSIEAFDSFLTYRNAIGIKARYKLKDLPFDNVNGFDGATEYDHNSYLTDLLVASHTIDPIFQKECQQLFNYDNFGIKCTYSSAPVKTKQRAIVKAELDYKDRQCM